MRRYPLLIIIFIMTVLCGCAAITPGRDTSVAAICGGAQPVIRASAVPPRLRDLVPFALRWGSGDPSVRDALLFKITGGEVQALRDALHGREREIREWIGNSLRVTGETCAFQNLLVFYEDLNEIEMMKGMRRPSRRQRRDEITPSQ
jgi:hypothetical protein